MNHYEAINDVLVHLFNEILDLEERALITPEYKDISVNDMHIIDAWESSSRKICLLMPGHWG